MSLVCPKSGLTLIEVIRQGRKAMRTDKKPADDQYGFTLIEVMIAMLVLSIGLMTVASGFINVMRIAAEAPIHLAAKEIAAAEIDNLTMMLETGMVTAATMNNQVNHRTNCMVVQDKYSGDTPKCYDFFVRTNLFNDMGVMGLTRAEITVSYNAGGVMRNYVKTTAIN